METTKTQVGVQARAATHAKPANAASSMIVLGLVSVGLLGLLSSTETVAEPEPTKKGPLGYNEYLEIFPNVIRFVGPNGVQHAIKLFYAKNHVEILFTNELDYSRIGAWKRAELIYHPETRVLDTVEPDGNTKAWWVPPAGSSTTRPFQAVIRELFYKANIQTDKMDLSKLIEIEKSVYDKVVEA